MSEFSAAESRRPYELPEPAVIVMRMNGLIRHWNNADNKPIVLDNHVREPRLKSDIAALGRRRIMPLVEYTGSEDETITHAPVLLLGSLVIARSIERGSKLYDTARESGPELTATRDTVMATFNRQATPAADAPLVSELDVDVSRHLAVGLIEDDSLARAPATYAFQAVKYYFDVHPATRP